MRLSNLTIAALALVGLLTSSCVGASSDTVSQAKVIPASAKIKRGLSTRSTQIGGVERTYYLYIPKSAKPGARLVIAFHGGGGTVKGFASRSHLREMADRYGFVLAMPEGVKKTWSAGGNPPSGYAEEHNIDDLGFVNYIIDDVSRTGKINTNRVYAMGMSKGGMMAYWAACNIPSRFAAIAVVSGTLSSGRCPISDNTSLLHIHGTNDQNVPFEGGSGSHTSKSNVWPSALEGIQKFKQGEQCSTTEVDRQVTSDTTCKVVACPNADTVEYCLVQNGGHAWPGGDVSKRQKKGGIYVSQQFDATNYIANFFLAN
ncbi:MAG: prolyl oligopeptidase family serine peptidase [Rhodobacteraceae bacterium]|nr:prolyl oligopeptidase family serine peptidase [Paracoccaceae bacterium]